MTDGVVSGAGGHVAEGGGRGTASGGRVCRGIRWEDEERPPHPLPFE